MTSNEITLVQWSFARVTPMADTAADLFYQRLFEIAPEVRPLFSADLSDQGRKLMAMLGTVVNMLDRPEALAPALRALASRHAGYGVRDEHYNVVGQALLDTLAKGLGAAFTDEVRQAWSAAYATLSGVMIGATHTARSTP